MKNTLIEQIDINDVKSIIETFHSQIKMEIEEMINKVAQIPVILTRKQLIEKIECSSSWLSKVTTSGEMPSIAIGGRVFYDLREIAKKGFLDNGIKWRVKKKG